MTQDQLILCVLYMAFYIEGILTILVIIALRRYLKDNNISQQNQSIKTKNYANRKK